MSSGQADWTLFAFSYSNFLFHGETSTFVWLFVKVQGLKMAKTVWKSERKIKMVDFLLCLGIRCTRQQVDASPLNWLVFFFWRTITQVLEDISVIWATPSTLSVSEFVLAPGSFLCPMCLRFGTRSKVCKFCLGTVFVSC